MIKIIKSLFLIVIFWGFMYGVARADAFWIEFIDSKGDGYINFDIMRTGNPPNQTYYVGVANIDHSNLNELLIISSDGQNKNSYSWNVSSGGSLLYDVYLTPDYNTYYWTSKGDATYKISGNNLFIDWSIDSIEIKFHSTTDTFQIKAVPVPSALWLFGSGILGLGLIRKKKLFRN